MAKDTRWDRNLSVSADAGGLIGHAGAVLLRKLADQCGLTSALGAALGRTGKFPLIDRGIALVSMAVAIALGATSMSDITVLAHQEPVFGAAPSDTTVRRTLELADPRTLDKIARARAAVRAHVWQLICATPAGFPWLAIAGKLLAGWLVIDLDATLITARSDKEGAAPTFKSGYGLHPLGAWLANTAESLAMLLRPGNAGSNTVADHLQVLGAALAQIPAGWGSKLLVRVDGAGATHDLVKHLLSLGTRRRTVLFTCGWMITEADEAAIRKLPAPAWKQAVDQDGTVQKGTAVAEISHLTSRAADWPHGLRWIVRRTKPSRRQMPNLTAFEKKTGWRYSIIVTNIPGAGIPGVPGSHHPQFIDVLHREHAAVEDRPDEQGHGAAEPAIQGLGGQPRLGARREHRGRPGRLVPAPRPLRLRRPQGRRAGHPPLPSSRPARPAGPACPQAHPQDQRHLAMEGGVHHLLAAAVCPARTQLTSTNHPCERKGACPARSEPVLTRAHRAMPSPAAITRTAQTGRKPASHNR